MPNPNIEGKMSKGRKCPILGNGEISSAYLTHCLPSEELRILHLLNKNG